MKFDMTTAEGRRAFNADRKAQPKKCFRLGCYNAATTTFKDQKTVVFGEPCCAVHEHSLNALPAFHQQVAA